MCLTSGNVSGEQGFEADDPAEVVDRHPQPRLLLHPHQHGLAFLGQVAALGGDEQGVVRKQREGTPTRHRQFVRRGVLLWCQMPTP